MGHLLLLMFAGETVAVDLSGDHPIWRMVRTGEAIGFDPTRAPWPATAAIRIVQRDLFGAPYQLGVTPPRKGTARREPTTPRGSTRTSRFNPPWRGRLDTSRLLQLREVSA
ncbi:MAG TPA: hypothetical protein VG248_17415 [Caulobacteraceae bacterium]|nr:hypothetical protein [Caulobacteraceae bacterium]